MIPLSLMSFFSQPDPHVRVSCTWSLYDGMFLSADIVHRLFVPSAFGFRDHHQPQPAPFKVAPDNSAPMSSVSAVIHLWSNTVLVFLHTNRQRSRSTTLETDVKPKFWVPAGFQKSCVLFVQLGLAREDIVQNLSLDHTFPLETSAMEDTTILGFEAMFSYCWDLGNSPKGPMPRVLPQPSLVGLLSPWSFSMWIPLDPMEFHEIRHVLLLKYPTGG